VSQDVDGVSEVTAVRDTWGTVDLTAAYAKLGGPTPPKGPARRVERGFAFDAGFTALYVVDEIDFPAASNVSWGMHVGNGAIFAAGADGVTATLTQPGGHTLYVRVLAPAAGAAISWDVPDLAPPQTPMHGVGRVVVTVGHTAMDRLVVALSPDPIPATAPVPAPLAKWPTSGPFPSA
jgi:hypothetical protein